MQALETVKLLSGMEPCYSGSLFLFDGLDGRGRLVKLRGRRDGAQVRGRGVKYFKSPLKHVEAQRQSMNDMLYYMLFC